MPTFISNTQRLDFKFIDPTVIDLHGRKITSLVSIGQKDAPKNMRILRALLAGILAILFTGLLAPLDFANAANPTFYQFDNAKIRIGSFAGENSIVSDGNLAQPWVWNNSLGNWRKLTYSTRQLENLVGVGGDGSPIGADGDSNWNYNGTISSGLSSVTYDYTDFHALGTRSTGAFGYGTIVATGMKTIGSISLTISNIYSLGQSDSFLKVTTRVTNSGSQTATNLRLWVGAPDDWIGDSDGPTKTRGFLSSTEFLNVSGTTRAPAIKVTSGTEGILFYSSSVKANSSISSCCSLTNAASTKPSSNTSLTGDGSYALYVRLNDLAQNENESFDWYYAAGDTASLTQTINQVAQAAASWTDQTLANAVSRGSTYSDQVTASGTGTITYDLIPSAGTLGSGQTSGLPSFLTLNSSTGTLTGTAPPDKSADGIYLFRIRATATSGSTTATSNSPDFTITVGATPNISGINTSATVTNGISISTITISDTVGFPAPIYSFSGSLPTGLTLNTSTGAITGTPSGQGLFTFNIIATNSFGSSTATSQTITVNRAPSFLPSGQTISNSVLIGSTYSSGVSALGWPSPTFNLKSGALPPGITLNSTTGALTGTPTATGSYSFVISATNSLSENDTTTLTMSVNKLPVFETQNISQVGYLAVPYSGQSSFSGFPLISYSVATGSLPLGLNLNSLTGAISGTPTSAGDYTFKIRATNLIGDVDTASISIHIHGEPTFSSSTADSTTTVGNQFSGTVNFSSYVDSFEVIPCSCFAIGTTFDNLPPGISFDNSNGTFSGISSETGTYKFRIRAFSKNHAIYSDSPTQTIEVRESPRFIDSTLITVVERGDDYADGISVEAYPSATYELSSGHLPEGISLDQNTGALTGSSLISGDYTFTLRAWNITGFVTREFTIRISELPHFTTQGQAVISAATINLPYNDGVSSLSFPAPSYSISSGNLPVGLTLNINSGSIIGTPTAVGTFNFVIKATNEYGSVETSEKTITIGSAPRVTTDFANMTGYVGASYSDSAFFSGFPAPTYSLSAGSVIPTGLFLNPLTGQLVGTPTTAGDYSFGITATNFVDSTSTRTYSLHVFAEPIFREETLGEISTLGERFSGNVSFFGPVDRYEVITCGCNPDETMESFDGLPGGLSLDSETGSVSGNSSVAGTYRFIIRAWSLSSDHYSDTPIQEIAIRRSPTWLDRDVNLTAHLETDYHDSVEATSYPSATYTAVGLLPAGITLDTSTGALSGRPTTPGTYNFSIEATNVIGRISTSSFALIVSQFPVPEDATLVGEVLRNSSFADGLRFAAYPSPTYTISSGSLPPGLSLDASTGAITGTPTTLGAYNFRIGIDSIGYYTYTTPTFNLKVEQAPLPIDASINSIASVGKNYSDAIQVEAFPLATYSITTGTLPRGLSLDATSGAITGIASETGEFNFIVTATNSRGARNFPLTISSRKLPSKPQVTVPRTMLFGEALNASVISTGYPAPTYSITEGSLPAGVSLNRTTGQLSGTPSEAGNYSFSVVASNDEGSSVSDSYSLNISAPDAKIDIKVAIGEPALGAPVSVESAGLKPNSDYSITIRSTPQVVGVGKTSKLGEILANVRVPENLEPGWHSITLETSAADGTLLKEITWFEITATGLLEAVQPSEPTASEKASALGDDNKFYESVGIDPGTQVEPAEVANTVQEVSSVVASVALVSAAAAATAAVASSAAAGAAAAASSAGSAGTVSSGGAQSPSRAQSGGSASSSSSSGSNSQRTNSTSSSNSSTNPSGGDADDGDGGDYGNLEADHDEFTVENKEWGDRLSWWLVPFMTSLDHISVKATEFTSKISPVLSRIVNDGSYLRAIVGGTMTPIYFVAILLGFASVDFSAKALAVSGHVSTLSTLLILGTLDALAGLLGVITFSFVSIAVFGIHSSGDIRYILAMTIAAFAPIILSTTFRKIRRPAMRTLSDVWERVIDFFMIGFVASLAVLSVVGGISDFAGATVPLAANAKNLVFVITAVALIRILLEEFAARAFPERLNRINPTEVPGPGLVQQWISMVFKYAVLVIMIGDMVGWGWWLWLGALIMFVPGIIGIIFTELPKSKLLSQIIPGGLAALLLATLLSSWSGEFVGKMLEGSNMSGPFSFLLVPLPVIIVAIIGMFADGSDKWYVSRNLKWVYVIGGIGVFCVTVWATDFIGQIFG